MSPSPGSSSRRPIRRLPSASKPTSSIRRCIYSPIMHWRSTPGGLSLRSFPFAFRYLAWQAQSYSRNARDLGPGYHCATCNRREKDLSAQPFQCPLCDLSRLYEQMIKNTHLVVWESFNNGDLLKLHAVPGSVGAELADPAEFPWPFPEWPLERVLQV